MNDIFQEGIYYKEVSSAQIENVTKIFNRDAEAIVASAAVDWNRNDINRMRLQMSRLKEEFKYVLRQLGVSPDWVQMYKYVINDDSVSDGVAQTSDKTDYKSVRYQNMPIAAVNDLYDTVKNVSGDTLNRVTRLLADINGLRLRIAKAEADILNKISARKQFEEKRDKDPGTFERIRDQYLELSAIMGYVEALLDMVTNYPSASPTDNTIRAMSEKFDLLVWKWRRYRTILERSVEDFKEKYFDALSEVLLPSDMNADFLNANSVEDEDVIKVILQGKFGVAYNKTTKRVQVVDRDSRNMLRSIRNFLGDDSVLPTHFTGVPSQKDTVRLNLESLRFSVFVLVSMLDEALKSWSGDTAKATTNSVVSRTLDKARQAIASPVHRTKVDPMTRDSFLTGTLIDFKEANKKIKGIRDFLELAPDVIRDKLAKRAETCDREFLRKVFARRSMPVKSNMQGVKPVEDAVRAKVRKRYGSNVPFEDEVNVSKDPDKVEWEKESYCEQNKDGTWSRKSEAAVDAVGASVDTTDTNRS